LKLRAWLARATALAVLISLAAVPAAAADPMEALRDAVAARLLLMDDVARFKWNAKLPITDPRREAALLERSTASAVALGLPEDYARRVLAAQIEASRTIQAALLDRWRKADQGKFRDVPDLATVQRPAIDRATATFLEALAAAQCDLADPDAKALLETPSAVAGQAGAWAIATAPLFTTSPCPRPPSPTDR
jgi:chorismate mutase